MARKIIDLTTQHPGWIGDQFPVAFSKVNDNCEELYAGQEEVQAALVGLAGKNMLMNCGVPINQRDFAGGALAVGVFGYDRWKGGNGGCNIVISSAGVWTLNGALQQVVEAPQNAWGRPITFSAESPSGPIGIYMAGAVGTIPAGSGRKSVTLTANGSGNMLVDISTSAATSFSQLQMERGEKATVFDARPIALETLLCERYGKGGGTFSRGAVSVATGVSIHVPVAMRATPAVTFKNVGYVYGCSGITANASATGVDIYVSATGAFAYGAGYFFDAEL
ncbi:TPA: hypothetical protein UL920_004224 [Stenotrophomonas maltophilia]|nr:hypothetical protein [Stenotrophomonas maltophilia]HEL4860695.1 hypothetical protein [Stenotrophomonas maltophilia]HEL7632445.1 hypothetical protein [Stenotrophomonas maltophilia]HEL7636214.1 hypothetical protein [Stenotrophomonas maltophilia]